MMIPDESKEPLTECKAGYLYLKHAFEQSGACWKGVKEFFESHGKVGPGLIDKVKHPSETIMLAIVGQNLSALSNYSPLFQNKREQASRLDQWTLFSLLSDFEDVIPWPPEGTLAKVRRWQQLDFQLMNRLEETGRNPFSDLTWYLLMELFRDDTLKLCQTGTTHLDPVLHIVSSDIFTIACSTTFSFWKTTVEEFELVPEPF